MINPSSIQERACINWVKNLRLWRSRQRNNISIIIKKMESYEKDIQITNAIN
jgi:hypothetical protein